MDSSRVAVLRELLSSTGWVDRTRSFASVMRRSTTTAGGLLLVGTPEAEPWHLAAHLDDESRYSNIPELSPTLVRWQAPADAPMHLSHTLARLETARRGETVFVVAETAAPQGLLERVHDARQHGATVLALDGGDAELEGLAHESLTVMQQDLVVPELSFDTIQHLVSVAAGESDARHRKGFRDRLARVLDVVSGPAPTRR
jgi:hypothetical protein